MKVLARKIVSLGTAAALILGAAPRSALSQVTAASIPAPAVDARLAMSQMRQWGVFKSDGDPLKSYLGDNSRLSPLGQALYLSLIKAHNPNVEKAAIVDEVMALKPEFDRLRENGPYNQNRQQGVARALKLFQSKMGKIDAASDGSVEGEFRRGTLREALMTGANVADPPSRGDMVQVETKNGFEFWDASGLAYRLNKHNATTYNRALQRQQHLMNQSRPNGVAFIPETGRYNFQMFDYSYRRLADQYEALTENMRRDRTMALADLLGVSFQYRESMWFTDRRVQADLEAQARATTYRHRGKTYSVLALIEARFKQRRYYLDGARKTVERYKTDMDALRAELKKSPVIVDGQAQSLSYDEQNALRYLSLGVLETQSFFVKNQVEHLDPSAPEAEQVMTAVDNMNLSAKDKARYKKSSAAMVQRLHALNAVLEKVRATLSAPDYAANLTLANAELMSSQRELGLVGTDYAMYAEVPSLAFLGRQQSDASVLNFMHGVYRKVVPHSSYADALAGIEASQAGYERIARLIASGRTAQARQAVIAMNPDAVAGTYSAPLGADPTQLQVTNQSKLAASLKVGADRISTVFETNKWLDAAGTFLIWTAGMAVAAPLLSRGFEGAALRLGRFTGENPAVGGFASFVSKTPILKQVPLATQQILLSASARLQSINPDEVWVQSQVRNAIGRKMLATTLRAGTVAGRQLAFTGMSAGISGVYSLGQHLWNVGSQKVFSPGHSATAALPFVGGTAGFRPADPMFSPDFNGAVDAFWTGAKGGAWWANSPISINNVPLTIAGVPFLFPAMLGYIGLPSTAFRGTPLMSAAEVVGARGVIGSALTGLRSLWRAGTEVEGVQRGFLEKLALKGEKGTLARKAWGGTAFTLSMADNVAKYAVFSDVAGWVGHTYAYHWTYRGENNLERRIEGANATGQKWLESPLWMLIPTYAAHQARDAALYMRAEQGIEQYREAGRDAEIANAAEGERLRFLETPEIPLSQRIFEVTLKGPQTGDYFSVTKEQRREALKREMVRSLGGEKAKVADINSMEFYRASKLPDGSKFIHLNVNGEFRLVAEEDFAEALLANPKLTEDVLEAPLGSNLEGFGLVTPEIRKDVAVALYSAEMLIGKPMPKNLSGKVETILKPYLEANDVVNVPAQDLVKALNSAPAQSPALDAALEDAMEKVSDWRKSRASQGVPYTELVSELRETADQMKADKRISAREHAVLVGIYDYVEAIEKRFNMFNTVEKTHAQAMESLDALKVQFEASPEAMRVLDQFSHELDLWSSAHDRDDPVDGPKSDGSFKSMTRSLAKDLKTAKDSISAEDFSALQGALRDVIAAPWVLHNAKGSAVPGWRPKQFESFMGALTAIGETGRAGNAVRLFQMLKTGGGKTLLTFEGLLPLVEADAANRHLQPMFLTVQSNLEAQARLDFLASRKIGSKLKFDTYEGFKAKIAEDQMKGRNTLRHYWILGDEMDGAALQAALTIGQVTGKISKRSPVYNRVDEIDQGLAHLIDRGHSSRTGMIQAEAFRTQDALSRLTSEEGLLAAREGDRLEKAAGRLQNAGSFEARLLARAEVRESLARLTGLLDAVPSREADAVALARKALGRFKDAISEAKNDAQSRESLAVELEKGFAREGHILRLTGDDRSGDRLSRKAESRGDELKARIDKLESQIETARDNSKRFTDSADQMASRAQSMPTPDRAERARSVERTLRAKALAEGKRAQALGEDLALAREELAVIDRFRSGRGKNPRPKEVVRLQRVWEEHPREAIMKGLSASADGVIARVRKGGPGWENAALRLLERRRQMMEAFAGGENPLYTVWREMKDSAQDLVANKNLLSGKRAVYGPAQRQALKLVEGPSLLRFAPRLPKLLWQVFGGREVDIPVAKMGLTRLYAAKMLKALADPTMPAHQRDNLFWSLSSSLLWPGRQSSSSWVRTELLRLARGFDVDPATVRLDSRSGLINVIHNGNWFESMDNEDRRFWELEYGVDLTLPYTNQSIATIRNVTEDKKARFISFSGTVGEELEKHFKKNDIKIVGEGSTAPENVKVDVVAGPDQRFGRIETALSSVSPSRGGDSGRVVLRRDDRVPAEAKPAIDAYLMSNALAGEDDAVVEIGKVSGPDAGATAAAQKWLRSLREAQGDTGLVVISVSDTRMLKKVRAYLTQSQGLKPDEIAMLFSDTEYLRSNVPEAKVDKQMNLGALDSGKARALILDTSVGGRGVDLNFKGDRDESRRSDPNTFRGYTNFKMLMIDPQKMSSVHLLQSEGRIDIDRVLPGARRDFSLVMDVKSATDESVFRAMTAKNLFFHRLRADPRFQAFQKTRGGKTNWATFDAYVRLRASSGTPEGELLAKQYEDALKDTLGLQQGEVEKNQLRSSSVLSDHPLTSGKHPGIEGLR